MVLGNASRGQKRHSGHIPLCRDEQSELQRALKGLSRAHPSRGGGEEFEKEEERARCSESTHRFKVAALQRTEVATPLGCDGRRPGEAPPDLSVSPLDTPSLQGQALNPDPSAEQVCDATCSSAY